MADHRQVPSVPANTDPVMRNFLSAVREALNNATSSVTALATTVSSTSVTQAAIAALSPNLSKLLDSSTPPTPTGFAVVGMRVNNFLKWTAPSYSNLNFTEVWRAPALMDAAGMVNGTAYVISILGTINWTAIGATAPAIGSLVNGTQYIITALGTINWNTIGVVGTPAIGTVFTYNGAAVTGAGGTVLATAFTKNATAITGTGGTVQFSPAQASAILIGTSNGQEFVDSVDPGSVFAYWIRHISGASVQGPWNSSTGTIGATSKGGGTGASGWTYTAENLYAINAWIAEADILDGTITNAKIGNIIQSSNYSTTGHTGWQLDKTGNMTTYGSLLILDNAGNTIMGSGGAFNWNNVTGTNIPAPGATVGAAIGTNLTGQFTAANITSFFASAAIGTAQIGNAAITNALIADAAVGTLTIAGQAVTVPLMSYATSSITTSGVILTLTTGVIMPSIAVDVIVTFGFVYSGTTANDGNIYNISASLTSGLGTHFNNNVGGGVTSFSGTACVSQKITIPANTSVTFSLSAAFGWAGNISDRWITVVSCKR